MHLTRWLPAALALMFLAGCAGYQLGPVNGHPAGSRSLQIQPIANQTLEPRLGEAVTAALRQQIQHDATYRLDTHGNGDVVLSGAITRYQRRELSFRSDDVLTVKDYRITLTARLTARERASGKVLFDQVVTGQTLLRVGTDLASAERQGLPLLAQDLAKNTIALLAEGSW